MILSTGDLWERVGLLEDDGMQVLITLFEKYEAMLDHEMTRKEAENFFSHLQLILDMVDSCNVNRR